MTIKQDPNAIQANGSLVFVRDPSVSTGIFSKWRRMGGLGNFTLPAETGSVTETALLDGSISFANVAGAGNVSGVVGALNAGPVHDFMEYKKRNGEDIQLALIRPAEGVAKLLRIAAATVLVDVSVSRNRINIPAAHQQTVKDSVLEGHIVAYRLADDSGTEPGDTILVAPFRAGEGFASTTEGQTAKLAALGPHDTKWHGIVEVAENGGWIDVAPEFGAAADIAVTGGKTGELIVRNPGRSYIPILGSVNQWDLGDVQAGAATVGNMQIALRGIAPEVRVERRLKEYILADAGYSDADGFTRVE